MLDHLIIIQARLGSKRFPNKVMQTVGGVPMVKRVWFAARSAAGYLAARGLKVKVVVAWPERYPDLDENDVLGRFQRVSQEFPSRAIIRLTADCPLLHQADILSGVIEYERNLTFYYNNLLDGKDVQIFDTRILWKASYTDKEHVIEDKPNTGGWSVNTKEDIERVRKLCATK